MDMCKGLRKVNKVRCSAIESDGWAYAYNGYLEGLKVDEEASKDIFWSLDLGIDILMLQMTLNHQNNTIFQSKSDEKEVLHKFVPTFIC